MNSGANSEKICSLGGPGPLGSSQGSGQGRVLLFTVPSLKSQVLKFRLDAQFLGDSKAEGVHWKSWDLSPWEPGPLGAQFQRRAP